MERLRSERAAEVLARLAAPAGRAVVSPRLLVVLAHPDDEVLAVGARLERMGGSRFVTVTDGAPGDGNDAQEHGFVTLDAYREARRAELCAALKHAGLDEGVLLRLGVPVGDQQASLHLAELVRGLVTLMEGSGAEAVLTHPYEGGHPDHDACAFAVHTAVRLMAEELPVLEAPFYHAGPSGEMLTGEFLPGAQTMQTVVCTLSESEQRAKRERLACFVSQGETLAQFGVEREMFRVGPRYDFTQRPHEGQLLYERFAWGMEGDRFCGLAQEALGEVDGFRGSLPAAAGVGS